MASKRTRANKPEMIHCPYCGEDYSSTYKHCPFCDEVEPAEVAAESRLVEESAKAFPGIDSLLAASLSPARPACSSGAFSCVPSPSCVPAAGSSLRGSGRIEAVETGLPPAGKP